MEKTQILKGWDGSEGLFPVVPDEVVYHIDAKTGKPTGGKTEVYVNRYATEESRKECMRRFMEHATGLSLKIKEG